MHISRLFPMLAVLAGVFMAQPGMADGHKDHDHNHDHGHDHSHAASEKSVYNGYFADAQIGARSLSDWAGDWQSVYPYVASGRLDPVFAAKAAKGDQTASDVRKYYDIGYRTDVDKITIHGDQVSFIRASGSVSARYESAGYQVLTYAKGNRGVRYIFKKSSGDSAAPAFIQFSDHAIAPQKAAHFHLFWGDDNARVLTEMDNWPTYYPAALTSAQIVSEMLAH